MKLNDEKKTQAEYDRFVDLMARMYLKYGMRYRTVTAEDVIKIFPKRQLKTITLARKYKRKWGVMPLSAHTLEFRKKSN